MPKAPGPKGNWLTGSISDFKSDPLDLFMRLQHEYGDVVSIRLATTKSVLVTHPEHIQYVLKTNRKNYSKRTRGIGRLKEFLGEGLLTIIDEKKWAQNRRIMQPVFRHNTLDGYVTIITELIEAMMQTWQGTTAIVPEMTRLTLQIAGRCFFDSSLEKTDEIGDAFVEVMEINQNRFRSAFSAPLWFPSPQNQRFHRALAFLDSEILNLIQAKRKAPGNDLLSRLIEAFDAEDNPAQLTQQLRDEAITMLGAGHETTANALIFTLDLLARHPTIYAKLRAEALAGWSGEQPSLEELKSLTYTTACIQESMRLNPPAWVFGRMAEGPDEIGGFEIPKDTLVMMSPFVTHRRSDFWDDPLEFRPDRFLEDGKDRHAFAFCPFSGGPRSCIGRFFGMMEMQVIVSSIARRFSTLERINPEVTGWSPLVTLRPIDDVPISFGV